jgi:CheY-like chemotaxis protein
MPGSKLLIVDDDATIRNLFSSLLAQKGYQVRTAKDGFSALAVIRTESPEVVVSDLNMPGMSGFELLSVVRRRFPAIRTVAMSGAFCGDEVPPGVAADVFFSKGSNLGTLLEVMERLPVRESPGRTEHEVNAGLAEAYGAISCLECLRTFSDILPETAHQMREIVCVYCRNLIQPAI